MVAEQVLRDFSRRRAGVLRSLGAQICVSIECADVLDVSNAERSADLSNVVSRTENSVAVQAWVQHGTRWSATIRS